MSQSLGGVPDLEDSFCPGRVDDDSGEGWRFLEPRVAGGRGESVHLIKDYAEVMGLTNEEFAAMIGLGYSVGDTSTRCAGLFCRFQHLHKNENIFLMIIYFIKLKNITRPFIQNYEKTIHQEQI